MSEMTPVLVFAAVVLVLLLYWTRRNTHQGVTIEQFSQAQHSVDSLIGEFSVARRIFEPNDMKFISRQPGAEVRRVFLQERKALAISWLRRVRREVASLVDLHLKLASYTNQRNARFDLKFLTDYLIFVVVCDSLLVLVWIGGPFPFGTIVGYTLSVVNQFCAVFSRRLEDINAGLLSPAHRTNVA